MKVEIIVFIIIVIILKVLNDRKNSKIRKNKSRFKRKGYKDKSSKDKRAEIKGKFGEIIVAQSLGTLDSTDYKIINDLTIASDGRSSQIDHIVISKYGIFVIETKNYSGIIYGNDYNLNWTQVKVRFEGRKRYCNKYKMYNPIKQNEGHIRALAYTLREYKNVKYIPIVVFNKNVELKINSNSNVVYIDKLIETISNYKNINLNINEVNEIYEKLLNLKITYINS